MQLCLEYPSWIVFIFTALAKFLYFSFPPQTSSLRIYLLSLAKGVWKRNVFQQKLAMITCFLKQSACPRYSGEKGSPASFKCKWSSRTILYNVRPKESNFGQCHCPLPFKYIFLKSSTKLNKSHLHAKPYLLNIFFLSSKCRAVRTQVFYFVKFNSLKIIHVFSARLTFIFLLVLPF